MIYSHCMSCLIFFNRMPKLHTKMVTTLDDVIIFFLRVAEYGKMTLSPSRLGVQLRKGVTPPWFALIPKLLSLRVLRVLPGPSLAGPELELCLPGAAACQNPRSALEPLAAAFLAVSPLSPRALTHRLSAGHRAGDRVQTPRLPSPGFTLGSRPLTFWLRCALITVFSAHRDVSGYHFSFRQCLLCCTLADAAVVLKGL